MVADTGLVTDFLVTHLRIVNEGFKKGDFDIQTNHVEEITGKPPIDLKTFLTQHKQAFQRLA